MGIFPSSVTPIIEFIVTKYHEGKQYSTLNGYRSALSATIPPIEGYSVGQHPLICRALQGSFNRRPPMPKYSSTWEVSEVVQHIRERMGNNTELSLKDLSLKLVALLALSNAPRASDIAALDIKFLQISPEGATFRIPGLTKTRRSGPPKSFEVKRFGDKSLCPVQTLEQYLCSTQDLRGNKEGGQNALMISFRKSYGVVGPATIGRWIKEILSRSGVDTERFSAHSTRSASATAAKKQGVSTRDIMDMAGWSRQSTFETFYHKPEINVYSEAVLGGKKGIER